MTRPPEYEQVAEWLNAINCDPRFVRELTSGYHDIKYAIDNGLTIDRYIDERRQFLTERARRALGGIDLDGKTTAQIAGEYHARQVAECAHRERDLLERIRVLKSGDFTVPRWCAEDAARDGISLAEAIERYRQGEVDAASEELDHLDCYYEVRDDEIQAYWAGRASRLGHDSPDYGRPATAGRLGQGAPAPGSIPDSPSGSTTAGFPGALHRPAERAIAGQAIAQQAAISFPGPPATRPPAGSTRHVASRATTAPAAQSPRPPR